MLSNVGVNERPGSSTGCDSIEKTPHMSRRAFVGWAEETRRERFRECFSKCKCKFRILTWAGIPLLALGGTQEVCQGGS